MVVNLILSQIKEFIIKRKKYVGLQLVHSHRKIPDPKYHSKNKNNVLKNKSCNEKAFSEIFISLQT
jgi:hypothetical protein